MVEKLASVKDYILINEEGWIISFNREFLDKLLTFSNILEPVHQSLFFNQNIKCIFPMILQTLGKLEENQLDSEHLYTFQMEIPKGRHIKERASFIFILESKKNREKEIECWGFFFLSKI